MKVRAIRRWVQRRQGGPFSVGRPCADFCPVCVNCRRFRFLRQYGRFPARDELWPFLTED